MAQYPNDTKHFVFDSLDNTTCTSSVSILFPKSDHDRTILKISSNNVTSRTNNGSDVHIYVEGQGFPNQIYDSERQTFLDNYHLWEYLPANKALMCDKNNFSSASDHIFFSILYTDYNLASVSEQASISVQVPSVSVTLDDGIGKANGISYADTIIITFLCVFFVWGLFQAIVAKFFNKRKQKYT